MTAVSSGIRDVQGKGRGYGRGVLCENSNKLVVSTKCRSERKPKKKQKHPTVVIRKSKCFLVLGGEASK